jgi:hypothetical protein
MMESGISYTVDYLCAKILHHLPQPKKSIKAIIKGGNVDWSTGKTVSACTLVDLADCLSVGILTSSVHHADPETTGMI